MLDRRALSLLVLLPVLAAGIAVHAGTASGDLPLHYSAWLDGTPVLASNPLDGTTWAAWAYRAGHEYDIAISERDASGFWSEPTFLGSGDRLDQNAPDLAVDPAGNLYVAYAVEQTGQVLLSVRSIGSSTWSAPASVNRQEERGFSPALRVVDNRLIVAFGCVCGRVVIRDFPLAGSGLTTMGIQDGPDGIDPLGTVEGGGQTSGGTPSTPGSPGTPLPPSMNKSK